MESLAARSRDEVSNLCRGHIGESFADFVDGDVVEEAAADGEEKDHAEVLGWMRVTHVSHDFCQPN